MIKDPVEVFRSIGVNLRLSQIVILVIIICLPESYPLLQLDTTFFISCPKMLVALLCHYTAAVLGSRNGHMSILLNIFLKSVE